jgi:hypothetical protein
MLLFLDLGINSGFILNTTNVYKCLQLRKQLENTPGHRKILAFFLGSKKWTKNLEKRLKKHRLSTEITKEIEKKQEQTQKRPTEKSRGKNESIFHVMYF